MLTRLLLACSFGIALGVTVFAAAQSRTTADAPTALRKYLVPYQPTRLEWELVQANQFWAGSFAVNSGSYISSTPIVYRSDRKVFYTVFTVHEERDLHDPDPFSQLPTIKKRSALQSGVDQLVAILKTSFPEIERQPELLVVEFMYAANGGRTAIARFERGALTLTQ